MKLAGVRRRTVAACGLAGVLLAGCSSPDTQEPDTEPEALPRVTLPALDPGQPALKLARVRGPAVLSFWASWCPPCRRELPVIQRYAERAEGRVRVIGIDFADPDRETAGDWARQAGVRYQLVSDVDGELSGTGPFPVIRGLPFLALVDAAGRVVHREFVIISSTGQLADLVAEHLGVRV